MNNKITIRDLHWTIKVPVILTWVYIGFMLFAFCFGFMLGIMGY